MRRNERSNSVRRSFTLVEMLTVVVIIALILGMALPGFVGMWEERKVAGAVTTLEGVLRSTRARAALGSTQGLFFFVDPNTHRQRIMRIVPDPPNDDPQSEEYVRDCAATLSSPNDPITDCITDLMAENRYRVVEGDVFELPTPVRVAPRAVLDDAVWAEEDIAHERFNRAPANGWHSGWPRHRNFFTVIFGPDGRLITSRDVIVHDIALVIAASAPQQFNTGYRTRLAVGDPTHYYTNNPDDGAETLALDAADSKPLYNIIVEVDEDGAGSSDAINFTSVDGLLVYDDNTLRDVPADVAGSGAEGKRRYLLESARPLYISRQTGEVLQGPVGENE